MATRVGSSSLTEIRPSSTLEPQTSNNEYFSCLEKVKDVFGKYFCDYFNIYLNNVVAGIGFITGAIIVAWAAKDIIREIFMHCRGG